MQGPGIGPARGVALLPPGLHEPRHWPRHRSALAALQVTFSFNLPLIHLSWISLSSHPWTSHPAPHRPFFFSWDSKMLGKEMPSLTWKSANHLAIAYQPDKVNLEEIIPVAIEKDGQYSIYTKFEILLTIQQGGFHSFHTYIRVFNLAFIFRNYQPWHIWRARQSLYFQGPTLHLHSALTCTRTTSTKQGRHPSN